METRSQSQTASEDPCDYPRDVVRLWDALERWWASGSHLTPTMEELRWKFQPVIAERTVARILARVRERYPQWAPSWPPKRSERPPWELPPADPAKDLSYKMFDEDDQVLNVVQGRLHHIKHVDTPVLVDGEPAIRVDEFDSVTHRWIGAYIKEYHQLVAAVVAVLTTLDLMSDGRADHIIEWCRLGISLLQR